MYAQMKESAVAPMTRTRYVLSGRTCTTSVWHPGTHAAPEPAPASHAPYALPFTVSACGSPIHAKGAPSRPAVIAASGAW